MPDEFREGTQVFKLAGGCRFKHTSESDIATSRLSDDTTCTTKWRMLMEPAPHPKRGSMRGSRPLRRLRRTTMAWMTLQSSVYLELPA